MTNGQGTLGHSALYGFLLRKRKAVLFLVVLLTVAGVFSSFSLPVSLLPSITFPRVVINVDAGDMPASTTNVLVTRPVSEAVAGLPGVRVVRTVTSRGSCDVDLNFSWKTNMLEALLLAQGAVNSVRSQLPPDTQIQVRRMDPSIVSVIGYSLTSDALSPVELRDLARFSLRPIFSRVPGVSQVKIMGGQNEEIGIHILADSLQARHVTLGQVVAALQAANILEAAGKIEADYQLNLLETDGRYESLSQIGDTVVSSSGGQPVFLRDVAQIEPSVTPQWVRVTADGRDAVLVNIYQQPGGNTVNIASSIKGALARFRSHLPPGVRIHEYYNQADLITEAATSVRDSILIGVALGVIVLYLFLRKAKLTLLATATVPVTVAITVLAMHLLGMSFNIMTLGGIAASIGLILDDAIVMVENIARHLELGAPDPSTAVDRSLKEIIWAFVGSSTTSLVVFVPLAFLSGVTGAFFRSLSLTMAIALFVSLLIALGVIPILAGRYLSAKDLGVDPEHSQLDEPARGKGLDSAYRRLMHALIPRPWILAILIPVMGIGAFGLYRSLGSGFLPHMDEGGFVIDYQTPPGTSLTESDRLLRKIEKILEAEPAVQSYSRRTGLQLGGGVTEANQGDFLVKLKPFPRPPIDDVIHDIRTKIRQQLPDLDIDFAQRMEDLIGDLTSVPQPVEIKVFGDDVPTIQRVANQVADELGKVNGVVDIFNGITIAGPSIRARVNPLLAGRYGVSASDVQGALQTAIGGTVATTLISGQKQIGLRVQLPGGSQIDMQRLRDLRIPVGHQTVALRDVAQLERVPGSAELDSENFKPMVAVTARLEGVSLGRGIATIQKELGSHLTLPSGVYLEYGGVYQEQQKSFQGLLAVLVTALLLVFLVLLFEFGSFLIPVSVFVIDVLSLFGVLLLLKLTHTPLNISSLMGMVMIVGIVAENAIFFLHYVDDFRERGLSLEDALIRAGQVRMRPIAMTTLAAVLALLPLALGLGAGAQMQQPLAIAVIGGFSFSMVLLLLVLPILYRLLLRDRDLRLPADFMFQSSRSEVNLS
ncbi:MAG: efflux RND transporter permease subunit [Cyanobacteria bacterium REEB65]|nr:efflux RND transporter permease subunit [Cyanobacteria bacterium REEB65]